MVLLETLDCQEGLEDKGNQDSVLQYPQTILQDSKESKDLKDKKVRKEEWAKKVCQDQRVTFPLP